MAFGKIKIKSIKKVKCSPTPVYDISVPKDENFILSNGLVVHNCKPYLYLRSAIYEHRFSMYNSKRLFDEFVDVERNINTGKIDHSPNGHKDVLDAVCGATFTASKYAEQYAFDYGEDLETTIRASGNQDQSQEIASAFQEELQRIFDPMSRVKTLEENKDNNTNNNKIKETNLDFGMGKAKPLPAHYINQGIIVF